MIKEMFFVVAFYENSRGLAELRILSGPHSSLEEAQTIKKNVWAKQLKMQYFVACVNLDMRIEFFNKEE